MADRDAIRVLRRHALLESAYDDGDNGTFLSGWQCENPWAKRIDRRVSDIRTTLDGSRYQSFERDVELADELSAFHRDVDDIPPEAFFCGEGGTSLILTLVTWLRKQGVAELFYVPPLYFTFHFALKLLGIRARRLSAKHPFEDHFKLRLPAQQSVVLLCDPTWYAGTPITRDVIRRLRDWQHATNSVVIVDGSFQYMRWDGAMSEPSSGLDPALTFRILCPTKGLTAHGYRFAYSTVPATAKAELSQLYARLFGSVSAESVAFSRIAMREVRSRTIVDSQMRACASTHARLRDQCVIGAPWLASSGYFVFERISVPIASNIPLMDGSYFEQQRFRDYRRINLLSPSIGLLG